jgi:twitching motility protein PilU
MDREQSIRLMQDLLRRMVEKKGSDLFITAGFPPAIKVDGEIRPQSDRSLSGEQSASLVRAIMNDRQTRDFDASKECNFAIAPPGIGRFRVSAFVQQGFTGAVLRTRSSSSRRSSGKWCCRSAASCSSWEAPARANPPRSPP